MAATATSQNEMENNTNPIMLRSNDVLQDVLSKQLQTTYPGLFDPTDGRLFDILADLKVKHTLLRLKRRNVLNTSQMELLYPSRNTSTAMKLKNLDLTLTVILLRNITTLNPKASWKNPSKTDTSIEAKIGKVKKYCNKYFLHVRAGPTDAELQPKFTELKSLLLSLSPLYTSDDYDKLLTVPLRAAEGPSDLRSTNLQSRIPELKKPKVAGQFPEEINRPDPLLKEAYQQACKDGYERVKRARVMLLGLYGAGKTHLRKRLLGKEYDEDKDRITNGIETDYVLVNEGIWNSDETDCHGPTVSHLLAANTKKIHEEIQASHAECLPSPGSSKATLSHLKKGDTELPHDIITHMTDSPYDIENPPARLAVWDFGGHCGFYNTHHPFLSSRAIYILAIDMSLPLTSSLEDQWPGGKHLAGTVLGITDYWIDTIHTYAPQQNGSEDGASSPRIIIACTHKDKYLENVPKEKHEEEISAYLATLRHHIQRKRSGVHVDPRFFAIDNTCQDEDHEISELRRYVMNIAESQKSWGEKNPIRWSKLEEELELRQPPEKRKKRLIRYEELQKLALEVGIQDEIELKLFLQFHHDNGDLMHFQTDDLSNIVILSPQWLINPFYSIFAADSHHRKTKGTAGYWFALKRGILYERLLDELWEDDSDLKSILISVMVKFNILLEQDLIPSTKEKPASRQFFVPNLLPMYKNRESVASTKGALFIQAKGNFMPHVLFNRLVVKLSQNSTSAGRKGLRRRGDFFLIKNEMYYDYAVFAIDPRRGALCALRKNTKSSCIELIPSYPPGTKFDRTIREAYVKWKYHVLTQLQDLNQSICPHLQLEWCFGDPRMPKIRAKLMAIDPMETDIRACGLPEDSEYGLWFMQSFYEKVHGASPFSMKSERDAGDAIETACQAFPRTTGIVTVFPANKANGHSPPFIAVLVSNTFCAEKVIVYEGFTVNYYSYDMPDKEAQRALFSQEAEENPIPPEKSAEIGQVIRNVSQDLFGKHRNLTIVSASPVKVAGGKISCMPCIVLYCHTKGVVPLGDSLFPESIEGIPVDVREGYVSLSMYNGHPQHLGEEQLDHNPAFYSDPLRVGCSIGLKGLPCFGTLGMFVQKEGALCFITCFHVLRYQIDAPFQIGSHVCQPSDGDQEQNNKSLQDTASRGKDRVCGRVREVYFGDSITDNQPYGIDAALVEIMNREIHGIPAGLAPKTLRDLHLNESELSFKNACLGSIEDWNSYDMYKCGRQTGLTKGKVKFNNDVVFQPHFIEYKAELAGASIPWIELLSSMVEVWVPNTENNEDKKFVECGDSGAVLFYLKDQKPHIVGMVVATTSHSSALITPIEPIFKLFNIELARIEEDMETECEPARIEEDMETE